MDEISEPKLRELKEAFDMFDKDHSGTISNSELKGVMKMLSPSSTDDDIADMMAENDLNKNGEIDFNEFIIVMTRNAHRNADEEEIINSFRVFDKDQTDTISSKELRHILTTIGDKLNDEEVDELIREADVDGNGIIHYVEFVRMMMAK